MLPCLLLRPCRGVALPGPRADRWVSSGSVRPREEGRGWAVYPPKLGNSVSHFSSEAWSLLILPGIKQSPPLKSAPPCFLSSVLALLGPETEQLVLHHPFFSSSFHQELRPRIWNSQSAVRRLLRGNRQGAVRTHTPGLPLRHLDLAWA